MTNTTEIYLCRAGQSLKQGRVEYSDSITNRAEAHSDAERRCARDKKLVKIAYYSVNEEGDFRVIYTHKISIPQSPGGKEKTSLKKKKKKPVKRSLLSRMLKAVFGSGKKSKKANKTEK